MGQFIYSPVNPIRLTHKINPDPRYNTVPFDLQQPRECYAYKQEKTDTAIFEFLSDWPVTLTLYSADGRTIAVPVPEVTLINNETYSLCKFTVSWGAYEGGYFFEATYTDDTPTFQTYQSQLIQVATKWPNTILFEYANSYNKFSAIFSDGTVLAFRIEGIVSLFNPEFDDSIYNDQYHNTELLNSIPFRTFTLDVGGAPLVPEWAIDRVNWIFGCDHVQIDGTYYRNTDGSKWDIERTEPDGTLFINGKLTIIEVNDLFLQELTPGETPTGGFKIVSRIAPAIGLGGNTVISDSPQFNENCLIKYITFSNRGADMVVRAGSATGIDDLMKDTTIPTGADTVLINQKMPGVGAVYITAPSGSDFDAYVGYDKFDAPLITPGSITTVIKGRPRSVGMYDFTTQEQAELDFDLATGLGIGDFAGTTIMGTNGASDWGGKVPMCYKKGTRWADIGITIAGNPEIPLGVAPQAVVGIGEYKHTLTAPELPKLEVLLPGATNATPNAGKIPFSGSAPTGGGLVPIPVLGGDASLPASSPTVPLQGLPHNNTQPSIYCIYYKELP